MQPDHINPNLASRADQASGDPDSGTSVHAMLPSSMTQLAQTCAFVFVYLLLDWMSYLHPMYGLNITPWNPSLAFGLVYWMRVGVRAAMPWFLAIVLGELVVRGLPLSLPLTTALACILTGGYGLMAEILRRDIINELLYDRRRLISWLVIVVCGTFLTSLFYISSLYMANFIQIGEWWMAIVRFWIGDCVGIVVTMPFFWFLFEERDRLRELLAQRETFGYGLLSALALWFAFGFGNVGEFKYFYFLFLPIVWAGARQGVPGAAIAAFILQAGIILAVQWQEMMVMTVFEAQLLGAILAFVGLFIGAVVDEKQRISNELSHSLRLAAAGEMAAALAHELNQPITAISAYGSACDKLLELNGSEDQLRDIINRMVKEANRASDVVRRLRDFFLAGTTRLEQIALRELIQNACAQFAGKADSLQVALSIDPLPDCTLLVDRLQLEVVLRNLLVNAFDAVAENPPGQRRIRIRTQTDGKDWIRIRIEDNGSGLSPAMVIRVFEVFRSSKANGLGLGLAMSRAIVEAHGGKLYAEAGTGGIFLLILPVEENKS